MEHDGGKRLKPKGALSALKQYKYVVLTAALGIFLLLLPSGEGKTADTGRRRRRSTSTARRCKRKWKISYPRSTAWGDFR